VKILTGVASISTSDESKWLRIWTSHKSSWDGKRFGTGRLRLPRLHAGGTSCRKPRTLTNGSSEPLSQLERLDLALAARMVGHGGDEPIASAQRVLDGLRRATPQDAGFVASLMRLRGFVIGDGDAADVLEGREGRFAPTTQEHRLLRGLYAALQLLRRRAGEGRAPDGWFLVELFRAMTTELPRFRNNDLRQGPPWDALLYVDYPAPEQLPSVLDTFDADRCYRDLPVLFRSLHPVRQGFRVLWRFARIAPFPDFNTVVAWLGMNAWLQHKGFPLLMPAAGDAQLLARLLSGPPPAKIATFETRLLSACDAA
jgi:hypothetical protein